MFILPNEGNVLQGCTELLELDARNRGVCRSVNINDCGLCRVAQFFGLHFADVINCFLRLKISRCDIPRLQWKSGWAQRQWQHQCSIRYDAHKKEQDDLKHADAPGHLSTAR